MSDNKPAESRADYRHFLQIPTRWRDNDSYGHMNNAVYYTMIEMLVMRFLEVDSGLDLESLGVRCFTVENGCCYLDALKYPDTVEAGLRVARLGNSSVRYEIGLFSKGDEAVKATAFVVDVFVDSGTERPVPLPAAVREKLSAIASV